jgi:hypothetical protein
MLMMTRPRGELSITHRAQLAAQNLFGDRQPIFVEHPLREINQPPAHDLVNRRDRAGLNHGDECAPLFVVEQRRTPRRFSLDETIRSLGVEPKHPIAKRLQADASEPSRVPPS